MLVHPSDPDFERKTRIHLKRLPDHVIRTCGKCDRIYEHHGFGPFVCEDCQPEDSK
jgi:hypothetical protein